MTAFNATVILRFNGRPVGTAFLVHDSGLLATCYHILHACFKTTADQVIGQPLDFVTLIDRESATPTIRQAQVTPYHNEKHDVALLQIQDELPTGLQPVKLIRSEHSLVLDTPFLLEGYAQLQDKVAYEYFSAAGKVVNTIKRDQVKVLQLDSKGLHQGMSGSAIYATHLGGVVGMQSRRLNLPHPNWGRDTGFACSSEAIVKLLPDQLILHAPTLSAAASLSGIPILNTQTLKLTGNITAQTVLLGDLGLKQSWRRPMEVDWPSQPDIPRPSELKAIEEELRDSTLGGLALFGRPGKSMLAIQYARQFAKTYPGGVLWVKLGENFDPQQDLPPILARWAAVEYGDNPQLADLLGQNRVDISPQDIRQMLTDHGKLLAVLDDVHRGEHLDTILEALPTTEIDLLITTPSQQSLTGAKIMPRFMEVQGLQREDAISFLHQRLPQLPTDLLEQLANTFDLPQALVLIATELVNSSEPNVMAQKLLQQQGHTVLKPIQAALRYSYQQLVDDGERQRFRQLGCLCPLPADFSEDLATALWDIAPETARDFLHTLQQRTLVVRGSNRRWSMNNLTYQFAKDLLATEAETTETETVETNVETNADLMGLTLSRYRLYASSLAFEGRAWEVSNGELVHLRYVGHQLIEAFAEAYPIPLDTLTADADNTLSEDQRNDWIAVANYLISARTYLLQPEAKSIAERWLVTLIMLGQVTNDPATTALGFFLLGQWYITYDTHENGEGEKKALQMFDRACPLWQEVGDIESVGYALINKGNTLRLQGETEQALVTFATALTTIDESEENNRQLRITLLLSLSHQYLSISEYDQAHQYLEKATALSEGQPFTELTAVIAQQLNVLSLNQGKPQDSMEQLQQVRQQALEMGRDRIVAELDISIGISHVQMGNYDAATEKFERLLAQSEALAYPQLKPPVLTGLAMVHSTKGNYQEAHTLLIIALEVLQRYQDKNQEAKVLSWLGEVTWAMEETDKALSYLKQALPLLSTVQDTTTAVKTLDTIGLIYQQTNRISEGLAFLKEELPRIQALNNDAAQVTILNWLARLLSSTGDITQAMEYFNQAEPLIVNIKNDIDRATIQTLTANLNLFIGKIEKAEGKVREVVAIWRKLNNQPKLSDALMLLANILFRLQKTAEVKQLLEEVNELTQTDDQSQARALYYSLKGTLELQASTFDPERLDEAQELFERSVRINKSVQSPEIHIINLTNLGWICFAKQAFEDARNYFEEAVAVSKAQELPPHIAAALTNLGFLAYMWGGKKSEAIQYFEEAISLMEAAGITSDAANQNIEGLRFLVQNISQENAGALPEESLTMLLSVENWQGLKFILEMRQESLTTVDADQILAATVAYARGQQQSNLLKVADYYRVLLERCRDEKRIPTIQAMQQDRQSIAVEHWWASLQRQNRHYWIALAHINRVLEVNPMDLDALTERGWINRGLGKLTESLADFDAALRYHRRDYRLYQGKGVVMLEWGKLRDAIALLTQAIELSSKEAFNHHWRGVAYQQLGDAKSALDDLTQAVNLEPQRSDHRYYRAMLYLGEGAFTNARRELTEVIRLDKENEAALAFDYFWRGVTNDQLKDADGAKFDWREGVQCIQQSGYSQWSDPLYASFEHPEVVKRKYHDLLNTSYPWHILPVQIQNQRLLEKLYPENTCYSTVKQILEKEFETFLFKQ